MKYALYFLCVMSVACAMDPRVPSQNAQMKKPDFKNIIEDQAVASDACCLGCIGCCCCAPVIAVCVVKDVCVESVARSIAALVRSKEHKQ